MSQSLGTNIILQLFTSSGSLDVSGDFNTSQLKYTRNNPQTTTYGKTTEQRIAGIRDWNLSFAGIYNSGTNTAFTYILADMAASLNTLMKWSPQASQTGNPYFSGCGLLSNIQYTGPVGGPTAMSFDMQSAAGSLTSACSA